MKYGELTLGQMEALVNKIGGMDGVKRILSGETVVKSLEVALTAFSVLVDYGRSVADGIKAGRYDWVNDDITQKNFPQTHSGEAAVEIQLLHFNRTMSSDDVLREMENQNLRPATLQELLALGEKYPQVQKEFPVVAIGSVWQGPSGGRRVPFLGWDGRERDLSLGWVGGVWNGDCRFAAVRK